MHESPSPSIRVPSPARAVPHAPARVVPHTLAEDAVALAVGTFVTSFGLFLIGTAGAVTGGTAGLVLLISQLLHLPFGAVFAVVNLPFAVLAWTRRGRRFVVSSVIAVSALAAFSALHPLYIEAARINPVYAVVMGNLACGLGLLIVLRHHSSLGGFQVLALICQDRLGWRAGYVLLVLDATVVALSAVTAPLHTVALSTVGVVVLNLVLVMNHRPGRYPAAL
ncbi:YitT family protein [Streptomyces sp. S.PB5]|uniref:YitT family protein n=1 Tax=Streptomyces sp. S.PB5 TaxID=3020844 RepID=UPI0025B21C58|nr:YitT family protein [Streptomyces sp. S.PB5]MDN3027694.1 YitT family protein [Streptomyces sp. S.PB5]